MSGPRPSTKRFRESSQRNLGLEILRIKFFRQWREKKIRPFLFEHPKIPREVSGVAPKILLGTELKRIHKQAHYDHMVFLGRESHKRQVPFVQITHGRHK